MRNLEGFGVGIRLRDVIGGFIVLLALAGCASTPDANYSAYIEANARAQQQQAAQLATIADADACNGDATCVVAAKAFAAMAVQGGRA